ncbi:MAG: hypothetical protein FJ293_12860 [Planctomycetes bacterium]|nr:hypothetical protein [Planctomycetota bacterium]
MPSLPSSNAATCHHAGGLVLGGQVTVDEFLAIGQLDAQSSYAISDTVPPGLTGLTMTLRGYVVGWRGKLEQSADEVLTFE